MALNFIFYSIFCIVFSFGTVGCSEESTSTDSVDKVDRDGQEMASEVKSDTKGQEAMEPQKATYTNGKARALIQASEAAGRLSESEYSSLIDMVETATADAYERMHQVIVHAASQMEVVEEITELESDLRVQYRYLEQLRTLMQSATAEQMGASIYERAQRVSAQCKAQFAGLDTLIQTKFN